MNVILLGAPGAGKGTQASRLKSKHAFLHLAAGDMLRAEVAKDSAIGKQVKAMIESGRLVPDDLMAEIIKERLSSPHNHVVFDGYPRNLNQAKALDDLMSDNCSQIGHVILIDVSESELLERINGRFNCTQCLTGYHRQFKPTVVDGVCDVCGSQQFTRRSDDETSTVQSRLEIFYRETEGVLPYYQEKGILKKINGQLHIDEVTAHIEKLLGLVV